MNRSPETGARRPQAPLPQRLAVVFAILAAVTLLVSQAVPTGLAWLPWLLGGVLLAAALLSAIVARRPCRR